MHDKENKNCNKNKWLCELSDKPCSIHNCSCPQKHEEGCPMKFHNPEHSLCEQEKCAESCICSTTPVGDRKLNIKLKQACIDGHCSGCNICEPQPTSDWEEEFDSRWTVEHLGFLDNSSIKSFIRQLITQAKEEGRREVSNNPLYTTTPDGVVQISCDGYEQSRLATITLFEEEIRRKKESYPTSNHGREPYDSHGYSHALTDLLLFTESLKKK